MIFHYVDGALMCEIRIPGLTTFMNRRFDYWWRDGSSPDNPNGNDFYGGYKHFLCESLRREAAQRIVTALGGYLADDSYIPAARHLGNGGPFFVHRWIDNEPVAIGALMVDISNAIYTADSVIEHCFDNKFCKALIYSSSGVLVMEISTAGRTLFITAPHQCQ
jgi:hypothetical protein